MTRANEDLPARLAVLISGTSTSWVMEQQPAGWKHSAWKAQWERYPLPCPHVLAELASEVHEHGRIRRKFIFDAYRDRSPTELFIAVMAWGLGLSNYGPSRARRMLLQPTAGKAIEAVVNAVCQDGAATGYSTYYTEGNTLDWLSVSFITKLIHFSGYESEHRPRPLIYDNLVATAITRLPTAPLLPDAEDLTTAAYDRYCRWAQDTATEHGTEPVVVEWALFALGAQIRDELRAERAPRRRGARKRTDR